MKKLLILTVLLTVGSVGKSYNILGVFPHNGKSHFDIFEPIMKELVRKGHKVTVISHFPQTESLENYEDISLRSDTGILLNSFGLDLFSQSQFARYYDFLILLEFGIESCQKGLNVLAFKQFLQSNNRKFDLIIGEFFNSECFMGLAYKFKAPLIGITTSAMLHWHNNKIGNPTNAAYIPNIFLKAGNRKSFLERLESMVFNKIQEVVYNHYVNVDNQKLAREAFGNDLPPLSDISNNVSLIFINSHFTIFSARPSVPGFIEIGGVHIREVKKLPQHLEKWINESTHGVIYFSLGSMIKGHTFPEDKRQMFTNAFKRLPQRVLWKWENETMPGKPDNVMIDKWMPQFDVLCHPNVKAFISHGGLLGSTEAVHCGVPMIVMPQFGDQFTNAKAIESSGGGVILDYRYLDEESIYNALTTVLSPSFNKQAKELSARFKDRPLPPLETAIYWVEYVARHRGAPHLRTAAVGMPLYQYLLLDVIAFLAAILFAFIFISYYITRALFRRLCKSGKSSEKLKEN